MKRLLAAFTVVTAVTAHADAIPKFEVQDNVKVERFYGYAYDLDSKKYLYTEVHAQRYQGDHWIGGTITYFSPKGTEIGRKVLDFSKDPFIPLYRLEVKNVHYAEGISKITDDKVYLFKQNSDDSAPEQATIDRKPNMAADSGFDPLIKAHFQELLSGKSLEFPLAVAGKLDYYNFTITRLKDDTFEGNKAVRFKVELSSLLRLIAGKPLILTYAADGSKLLEYRGISNLYDPKTDKPYQVRIDYYSKPPADAPKPLPPLEPGGQSPN